MKKTSYVLIAAFMIPLILLISKHFLVTTKGADNVHIIESMVKQRMGMEVPLELDESDRISMTNDAPVELDADIMAFTEIGEQLGELAKSNNVLTFRGVAVFDANGDGRADLFFTNNGRPLSRPNNEAGVLQLEDRSKAKPCALYLNMGNDEQGKPQFRSVQDLMADDISTQDSRVKEELLFENKYQARRSLGESPYEEGRISYGVSAADYNGDGRVDLLILNHHYGMPFSVPGLGIRAYPGKNYVGRYDKSSDRYIETTVPEFLKADLVDGMKQEYRGTPEGMNTLLINRGDLDGDGIPEWEDMTKASEMISNFASASATVGDIDRDGDLDIYICNFTDPDFWGFGAQRFAGQQNELWINQLSETGEFRFVERAVEYGVSGLYEEEELSGEVPIPGDKGTVDLSTQTYKDETIGQRADHSWAAQFVDFNEDGFLDLIVANDIPNRLRIYQNTGDGSFERLDQFDDPKWIGSWMGIASGDLNGDQQLDVLMANCGAQSFSVRNTALFVADPDEMNVMAMSINNAIEGNSTMHHSLLSFNERLGMIDMTRSVKVRHSSWLAPDIADDANVHPRAKEIAEAYDFKNTIAGLEFAWNPVFFDLENDGDQDVYMVGSLNRGNDNFIGDWTNGPGRMLVNTSEGGGFQFEDRTLETQLLDIKHMDYSSNPPKRKAPGTGWHKEDYVHITDLDGYQSSGREAAGSSRIKDIFRMHEQATSTVAADLNGDGSEDLIVLHLGGYTSLSPDARNLKLDFLGKKLAVPPPNKVVKAPTTFEEGPTFMYINGHSNNNWISIQLHNDHSYNPYAIGAKVVVNGKWERQLTCGGQSFSGAHMPLHFGLGEDEVYRVEVFWPDGEIESTIHEFEEGISNQSLNIYRSQDWVSK